MKDLVKIGETKNRFYSGKRAMSYGTPFIFTLGTRSIGKSFDWTSRGVINFLSKGEKFIYMRRTDEDLKRCAPTMFNNIQKKFPTTKFEVCGNGKSGTILKINERICGQTIALSLADKFKSVGFDDYTLIFFDEFLPDDGRFMSKEVGLALGFYQSVARGYDTPIRTNCRFVFAANHVTLYNPYFIELGILQHIKAGTKYTVDPDRAWVCEITDSPAITQEIYDTPFGKMLAKTKYGDYALKGMFYLDNNEFIEKPKSSGAYYCTLVAHGVSYGVYEHRDEGLFYVSTKVNPDCRDIFALYTDDHKPNTIMIYHNNNNPLYLLLRYAYDMAAVRFEDGICKNMFMEFMAFTV